MEAAVERAGNANKNIAILTLPNTKIEKSLPVNSWIRKDRVPMTKERRIPYGSFSTVHLQIVSDITW